MFYCCWTKVLFKVSLYGWRLWTLDGGNSQTKMRHNCCMNTIHSNLTETNFTYKLWYIFNSIIGHFLDLTSLDRGQAWRHLVEAWELGWLPYKEFHRRPPLRPSTWSVRSGLHRAPGFFLSILKVRTMRWLWLVNNTEASGSPLWCRSCTHSCPQTPSCFQFFFFSAHTILVWNVAPWISNYVNFI